MFGPEGDVAEDQVATFDLLEGPTPLEKPCGTDSTSWPEFEHGSTKQPRPRIPGAVRASPSAPGWRRRPRWSRRGNSRAKRENPPNCRLIPEKN